MKNDTTFRGSKASVVDSIVKAFVENEILPARYHSQLKIEVPFKVAERLYAELGNNKLVVLGDEVQIDIIRGIFFPDSCLVVMSGTDKLVTVVLE